ncbi:GntP family permease [Halomonas sp. M1]|uniref:GntP family permease n=1 Tax=unclassified Halomonas TaxID=2609666 RepID=UPI00023A4192|nr:MULTISPECIES: GntP family permease [unclassified Halomonas]AVI63324.1 citrate transporter [Halomonas sp. GFAJ-1]EHK62487.1 citrate transporter [Halomonas sp. GFAJ-1]WFE72028.1 GntP family permease [Halomonas sp. M1]
MGMLAIIISLLSLMFLAYRGISVLLLAPLMASLAVLLSGDAAFLLPIYTDTFMKALGNYVIQFFPLFLLGALFGQLMADSGAAQSISNGIVKRLGTHHVVLTVVIACAVLTYGGVSLFVVAFAIYPISRELFRQANVPKRLIPASIALGSFTFTMTALPGTPAIQNAIPIPYFGTNSFAAPGLGIIAGLIMLSLGIYYLQSRVKKAAANNEGYGKHTEREANPAEDTAEMASMPLLVALIPLVMVIGLNALFTYGVFPAMDLSYISDTFEDVTPSRQTGLWAILIALLSASAWLIISHWRRWENLKETINKGCFGSLLPIFNTASEVGYGAVIASLAGFVIIRDAVLNVSPGNPLVSEALAMSVLAGITGSSSGGLSIALETLGSEYLAMAEQAGISPELMHRVATLSAGGMDTLPHSGAVITLLAICGLTHRQSYGNLAMVTIVLPIAALVSVITLGTLFGSF